MKLILSLCDRTGNWSRPYEEAGYRVVRVDLERGEDVRLLKRLDDQVHGVLAAPPCTHFARVGAPHWAAKGSAALLDGLSIVDACLRVVTIHKPEWWALENPIGRLQDYLGKPAWKFEPYWFGDPWTKRTWLWGRFTIPNAMLCPSARNPVPRELVKVNRTGFLSSRSFERSATPPGFARAFFEANP